MRVKAPDGCLMVGQHPTQCIPISMADKRQLPVWLASCCCSLRATVCAWEVWLRHGTPSAAAAASCLSPAAPATTQRWLHARR